MSGLAAGRRVDRRAFVLPGVLVVTWSLVAASGRVDPHLVVPPYALAVALAHTLASPDYWLALGSSLGRVVTGFVLGAVAGVALGTALGTIPLAARIGGPSLSGARQVALFAWIPLLTAWFGDGETAKVLLIALAAFFPIALNTELGCRQAPRALLEVARVLEFDRWATLRLVTLPAARRAIFAGLQIGLATAWIGTIGAEYLIDQGNGLGVALSSARIDDRMDLVVIDMVTLALIGLGLGTLVRARA